MEKKKKEKKCIETFFLHLCCFSAIRSTDYCPGSYCSISLLPSTVLYSRQGWRNILCLVCPYPLRDRRVVVGGRRSGRPHMTIDRFAQTCKTPEQLVNATSVNISLEQARDIMSLLVTRRQLVGSDYRSHVLSEAETLKFQKNAQLDHLQGSVIPRSR